MDHATRAGAARRLGRPRLLLLGCGDVGLRIVARLHTRFRIVALTSTPQRVPALRAAGVVPLVGDLDRRASLDRLRPFALRTLHLVPPQAEGTHDRRTRQLRAALGARPRRFVYVSTTGVYGDARGAWLDETARAAARTHRARRRVDGERVVRGAPWRGTVLRVPGIYAHDRLPLDRLQRRLPALAPDDDVYTDHIHAEDLARAVIARCSAAAPAASTTPSTTRSSGWASTSTSSPPTPASAAAAAAARRDPRGGVAGDVLVHGGVAPPAQRAVARRTAIRLRWPTVQTALAKPAQIG